MNFRLDKLKSPQYIFIIYVLVSSLLIMIFRFIFPGSETPLIIYSRNWRITQGILEIFNLFPALAFSALVIPFGIAAYEENYQSFSDMFFKRMVSSVITAIIAAVIYGVIFFFALPMVKNHEENYRFSGELYHLARKNALERMEAEDWYEASQFMNICNLIWHNNEELENARDTIKINLARQSFREGEEISQARATLARNARDLELSSAYLHPQDEIDFTARQDIVDSTAAITMSLKAFEEKRYFDAHWLANLGASLAVNGSVQERNAARLASEAWNMIITQTPNQREEKLFDLYAMKIAGYNAMTSRKWIDAYYIFYDLVSQTPDDPDAARFLAQSEEEANKTAFFIDEMNISLGEIFNNAIFSLPDADGRAVLRFSTLTTTQDVAYGIGFEYMKFDEYNNLKTSVRSRYAKITPFNNKPQILILSHALDRHIEEKGFKSEWFIGEQSVGGILLDVSFEDFLLVSRIRHGLSSLQVDELYTASKKLETAGFVPQVFQAEILNRFGSALFFLPMAIFIIIAAWRYRAKEKPRYLFGLLLPILPVVFHGFVFLYRAVFNTLGIWLVLSFGFFPALIIFVVILALLLFVSLIVLSSQHS